MGCSLGPREGPSSKAPALGGPRWAASISAASNEQDLNAQQINSAINEINSNIQTSASTAEEMSASAEELQEFANKLVENIALFNTQKTVDTKRKKKKRIASKISNTYIFKT